MAKRGAKPRGKISIKWSADFAYAIGLMASDGCLSGDGRHITFTSKDKEQIVNFMKALKIKIPIGLTWSGSSENFAYRIQFSEVRFHNFLVSIGITPAKSKDINEVEVPDKYFFDFLRGLFDGDGTIYSYWDKRWKSSFMYYVSFATASDYFVVWLRYTIERLTDVFGHVKKDHKGSTYQLTYAKRESLVLLRKMYKGRGLLYLSRKRLKSEKILGIVGEQL